jgi:hypothetical protein
MRWLLKRWWFWAGTAFMLVAVSGGYLFIPVEQPRITQANCGKIQLGWSYKQVVDLLGEHAPPTHGAPIHWAGPGNFGGPETWTRITVEEVWWDEDSNHIAVIFEMKPDIELWRVAEKKFVPAAHSFFERMKRRIERRILALWP